MTDRVHLSITVNTALALVQIFPRIAFKIFKLLFPFLTQIPFGKYLGFPIKDGRLKTEDFNFNLEKEVGKLSGWKANLLSMAGRRAILQSTSLLIVNYYVQCSSIPKSICEMIDREHMNFVWGCSNNNREDELSKLGYSHNSQKSLGLLGPRKTRYTYGVASGKLNWRVRREKHKLWSKCLTKYAHENLDKSKH